VALVDVEGLAALTMRRLAASLDVEAMSLYHHVPSKQALLDGVVEAVVTEILDAAGSAGPSPTSTQATPATPAPPDWRAAIRCQFLAARQVMLRHPWMPALLAASRTIPPAVYGYYDAIVGTLVAAGFSYHLAHRAIHALGSLPLGSPRRCSARRPPAAAWMTARAKPSSPPWPKLCPPDRHGDRRGA